MFATGGRGVTTGVMNVVGCVEHSDTRHLIINHGWVSLSSTNPTLAGENDCYRPVAVSRNSQYRTFSKVQKTERSIPIGPFT
jgi:hypothetical protein